MYEGRVVETQNKMSRVYMSARLGALDPGLAARHLHRCALRLHPAGGTEIPTFLSYAVEKKLAKGADKEEFGTTGAIEGVAGPEAAPTTPP